ncbi:MAG TPA: glycerol-3-phosphate 1-O-acyltransferase PlsY [Bryobacteraceae bacterium]|nr:glycerol-3-phosphate 1-O-acyltransferase PlsY [Bryobacteraceae bacterium]
MIISFLSLLAAYFIGAVPFGYLVVKWKTGADVRAGGSGNIGATNVLRTTGRAAGIATLLLDIAKGAFAVWLMDEASGGSIHWMSAAALAVMAGHAFPVFLRFKGGKAVASYIGAFLYLAPLPLLAVLIVWLAAVAYTRYVSAGSILAAATFPLAVWLLMQPPLSLIGAAIASGAFIIYRHRDNMARIRAGTEHVLSLGIRKRRETGAGWRTRRS